MKLQFQGCAHQNKLQNQGQNSSLSHFFVTAWPRVITFLLLRPLKTLEAKHYVLIFLFVCFLLHGTLWFCFRFFLIMLLRIPISKAYISFVRICVQTIYLSWNSWTAKIRSCSSTYSKIWFDVLKATLKISLGSQINADLNRMFRTGGNLKQPSVFSKGKSELA